MSVRKMLLTALAVLVCQFSSSQNNFTHTVTVEEVLSTIGLNPDSLTNVDFYCGTTTARVIEGIMAPSNIRNLLLSNREKIVIFVDEEPQKGWEHNCSYYYAPKQIFMTNDIPYFKVSSKSPKGEYELSPYRIHSNHRRVTADVPKAYINDSQANEAAHTYAIILSGGANKMMNYVRYWNDCSFIYQTLTRRFGVSKDHISILMSDGTDPTEDMNTYEGYISSPLDLDGDDVADIQYAATKESLTSELNRLSNVMTTQDRLFIYVIDHGGTDDNNGTSYICLWNNQKIYDYELAALLNNFNVSSMNIVLGQCFSGGFIDNLQGNNKVITTACTASQSSWACSNLLYDEFVYHWTSAVNESDAYGNYATSDADNNGFVTMSEAYNYAVVHDIKNETPQFSSQNTLLGQQLALNATPFSYHLMIKDNPEDDGTEPNTTTEDFWSSCDMWVRNQPDGILHQEHECIDIDNDSIYIYVKIRNNGEKPYVNGNMYLHIYWAPASLGLTKTLWEGHNELGGCLEPKKIKDVTILPDGSFIYQYAWALPDSYIDYIDETGDEMHMCLLAAVHSKSTQMLPLPLIPGTDVVDVLSSNWIAQRNVIFYQNGNYASNELPLFVRNVTNEASRYSIELIPVDENPEDLSHLEVSVRLSNLLYSAWQDGGYEATNAVAYPSMPQRFYMMGANSSLGNMQIPANLSAKIYCSCNLLATENITEETVYKYNLIQRDKVTGTIVGGERIEIKVTPRLALVPSIHNFVMDNEVILEATNICEPAKYEWFDKNGKTVGIGERIAVVPTSSNKDYTLRVESEIDGAVSYAVTSIEPATMGFERISPIPFRSHINIKLMSPADNNTEITLTSVTGKGLQESFPVKNGERELTIYTSQHAKGNYLLSLIRNGAIIETKQIIHE